MIASLKSRHHALENEMKDCREQNAQAAHGLVLAIAALLLQPHQQSKAVVRQGKPATR